MSKNPPTKTPKGSNESRPSQPFHSRRNSASSMYANPDEDPDYQQDPVIEHDGNAGERNSQTNGSNIDGQTDQSTQNGK